MYFTVYVDIYFSPLYSTKLLIISRNYYSWRKKLLTEFLFVFVSECRFGDQRYELEHTWHPDLGPPFGVMYCVHCECVPVRIFFIVLRRLFLSLLGRNVNYTYF